MKESPSTRMTGQLRPPTGQLINLGCGRVVYTLEPAQLQGMVNFTDVGRDSQHPGQIFALEFGLGAYCGCRVETPACKAGLGRNRVEGGKGAARIPVGIMLEIRVAVGARFMQDRAKIDNGDVAVSQER